MRNPNTLKILFVFLLLWPYTLSAQDSTWSDKLKFIASKLNRNITVADSSAVTQKVWPLLAPGGMKNDATVIESWDPKDSIFKQISPYRVGYVLDPQRSVKAVFLKFLPTDAKWKELDSILGPPNITNELMGEDIGSAIWTHDSYLILRLPDGPYDWPIEMKRTIVYRFTPIN